MNILVEFNISVSLLCFNKLYLSAMHTGLQTECNCDRGKFMAGKIQDKHSISPLGDAALPTEKMKGQALQFYAHCRLKSDYFFHLL